VNRDNPGESGRGKCAGAGGMDRREGKGIPNLAVQSLSKEKKSKGLQKGVGPRDHVKRSAAGGEEQRRRVKVGNSLK